MDHMLQAIDCDVHPTVPSMKALLPYLDDYWRDSVRGARHRRASRPISYPPNAPITSRPDWRGKDGRAATEVGAARRSGARPLASRHRDLQLSLRRAAALQRGHGAARSRARSTTGSPRNGSTAIRGCAPRSWSRPQNTEYAVTRSSAAPRTSASCRSCCSPCRRCRSGAGSSGRSMRPPSATACRSASMPARPIATPITSLGWPSYYIEDYAAHAQAFQSQVASLICEGVFAKFPGPQGGAARIGRDLAARLPLAVREILARRARRGALGRPLAGRHRARPFSPDHPAVRRPGRPGHRWNGSIDHLRSDDMLLYASDFPHWQFDGDDDHAAGIRRRCVTRSWSTTRLRPMHV